MVWSSIYTNYIQQIHKLNQCVILGIMFVSDEKFRTDLRDNICTEVSKDEKGGITNSLCFFLQIYHKTAHAEKTVANNLRMGSKIYSFSQNNSQFTQLRMNGVHDNK